MTIPFNKPHITGKELCYMAEAMRQGHLSGNGPFTQNCEALLREMVGTGAALLTSSCTDALEMAAILLDIEPGDEVIVPAFTFVSTVNAFVLRGAVPVFADIRRDTLNLDEAHLEALITPSTRAIVLVHYAGVGCELDAILEIAHRHHIPVIEDNAHGLFGTYKRQPLGSFGCLATLSFHETKNVTCGEGGALLINDARYTERAEIIREKGTDRNAFLRGQVDKYTWMDLGSSFLPSDLMAAFLYAQLEEASTLQARRQNLWENYDRDLHAWRDQNGIKRPTIPAHCQQAYHMYYLMLPSPGARTQLMAHFKQQHIVTAFHYQPLHLSEMGRRFGGTPGMCPVTEDICDRLLRLPFYCGMTETEQERVIAVAEMFSVAVPLM
jgi:dTDP-4-amino-4,6-dideoxygalactose transaminase